jgi:hypothetical protein
MKLNFVAYAPIGLVAVLFLGLSVVTPVLAQVNAMASELTSESPTEPTEPEPTEAVPPAPPVEDGESSPAADTAELGTESEDSSVESTPTIDEPTQDEPTQPTTAASTETPPEGLTEVHLIGTKYSYCLA